MQQVREVVLIADDLLVQFRTLVVQMVRQAAGGGVDLSEMRAESRRLYSAVWERLDEAAAMTLEAGRSVEAYDDIREDPGLDVQTAFGGNSITTDISAENSGGGVLLARKASAALKAAWPDIDWTAAAPSPSPSPSPSPEPEPEARRPGLFARLFGRR